MKKGRSEEKGSEVCQKVKRVRPSGRRAYISCRRAGLSHTRVVSSASPTVPV